MPPVHKTTQYSEYLFEQLKRVGQENPGLVATVDELAAHFGLKVTPSFRKRMKQAAWYGIVHDVPPGMKRWSRKTEYRFPAGDEAVIPF